MTYDPHRHHRRSIRLKGYDYTQPATYFITVVTQGRECLFGGVVDGEMLLNERGTAAEACWTEIPRHFPHVELDAFVIMPNHIHGILCITDEPTHAPIVAARHVGARHVGARHAVPLRHVTPQHVERFSKPVARSIPTIVRSFKSATTKRINQQRATPGLPVWQRNYYEHIVRDEASLDRIRRYILDNPARWPVDRENPHALAPEPEDAWRA